MSKFEHMGEKRDKQALKQTIEDNLRQVYQTLLQEEVPDRFQTLLERLRQQTGTGAAGGGAAEPPKSASQPEDEK